jgi:hypothetical protein
VPHAGRHRLKKCPTLYKIEQTTSFQRFTVVGIEMGLRRDLTAGSSIELCRELGPPPFTLGPERLLRGLFILSQLQRARKFR